MAKFSARAQWNTANARLANKPFDDLFDAKEPATYTIEVELDCALIEIKQYNKDGETIAASTVVIPAPTPAQEPQR